MYWFFYINFLITCVNLGLLTAIYDMRRKDRQERASFRKELNKHYELEGQFLRDDKDSKSGKMTNATE